MRINHNISSMITQGALFRTDRGMKVSLERLSTGLRINRASDDAAGLSVSESLRTQVRGMQMAKRNAGDGIALLNIAEGAANEISAMLQRMRELAIQAATDTLTTTEQGYLNVEFLALQDEIDRISASTQYNGQGLLDGTGFGTAALSVIHIGPNNASSDTIGVTIDAVSTGALGVSSGTIQVNNTTAASAALTVIDTAIGSVNSMRSSLGAFVNRLEHTVDNLDNATHNTQAAESVIRDVDFGTETTAFTKHQILMQSATAMLAQANSVPQNVLALLG